MAVKPSLRRHGFAPRTLAATVALGAVAGNVAAQSDAAQVVEIISTSPLPGQGIDRDLLPYQTQLLRRSDIGRAQAENASDLLLRRAAGVLVSDVQGSPYQGDLSFRGFRASGLLGAAQGLSVYLDGVRVNEPFGDVVNWDALPDFALDTVALVPGANPAFGLNTLGGAVAMTTVDGRSAPGWRAEASAGSFGRQHLNLAHGGSAGHWQHYIGMGLFEEDGWRDFSAGHLATLLAKTSLRTPAGEFGVSLLTARSRLVGNGLVPLFTYDVGDPDKRTPDLGAIDRAAVYTHPDQTRNRSTTASARWQHALGAHARAEAMVYARHARRSTINGDVALGADPDVNASFNRTATRQRGEGLALGISAQRGVHQWQAGLNLDRASVSYEQTEQEGQFTAARSVSPAAGAEPELSAAVQGRTRTIGVHLSDTWALAAGTHLTGTLRLNDARVGNQLTSVDDDSGAVQQRPNESFRYRHWNPALGIAQRLGGGLTAFANIARNTRVPTVIELGCADPDQPCRLPAGLQSDPYLAPVRSTTVEAGVRGGGPTGHRAALTFYRTDNRDDILFSSVSLAGQLGYFRNFERTRHQGFDAQWQWRGGAWDLGLAWSQLDATYRADGVLRVGERNVVVAPGTRIAGLPRQQLKASVDWTGGPGWSLGADWQAVSRRVSAGNEDGRFDDDATTAADFSLPGHALLHLRAIWRAATGVEFFVRLNNVTDRRSASFGALAQTQFDALGQFCSARNALFVAPGAPRSLALGVRAGF